MTVEVAVRATNAAITDGAGREVTVPANDRVEVRFPAAAEMAGTARFQIGAAVGPLRRRRRARAAGVDAGDDRGVRDLRRDRRRRDQAAGRAARKVVTQFGGLEVTTSSTKLQALTDALLYLVTYPYECAEQLVRRILGDRGAARRARPRSRPRTCRSQPSSRRASRATSSACARCRTTTAASRSGSAATSRGRTSPSTSPTRSSAPRRRASTSRPTCSSAQGLPRRHRAALPLVLPAGRQADAARLRALRAQAHGRPRHREGARRIITRGRRRRQAARWRRTAGCSARWPATAARAGELRRPSAAARQPGHRDRRRRELHDQLRRRRLPAPRTPTAASTASCSSR